MLAWLLALAACEGDAARRNGPAPGQAEPTQAALARGAAAGSVNQLPKPVLDACDAIAAIAGRTKGITQALTVGQIEDDVEHRRRAGCEVRIEGSFAALAGGQAPLETIRSEFEARGWQEDAARSADGPDGTRCAFVRDSVMCFFEGRWDGGDDSDPSYKPDDRFTSWGRCAVLER
jgi:hypothetical protein